MTITKINYTYDDTFDALHQGHYVPMGLHLIKSRMIRQAERHKANAFFLGGLMTCFIFLFLLIAADIFINGQWDLLDVFVLVLGSHSFGGIFYDMIKIERMNKRQLERYNSIMVQHTVVLEPNLG